MYTHLCQNITPFTKPPSPNAMLLSTWMLRHVGSGSGAKLHLNIALGGRGDFVYLYMSEIVCILIWQLQKLSPKRTLLDKEIFFEVRFWPLLVNYIF